MYRLASNGLMTPPCGVPCLLFLPPVMYRFPLSSRSSTRARSHSLISGSTYLSIRLAMSVHAPMTVAACAFLGSWQP
jgi:hypothetical protein